MALKKGDRVEFRHKKDGPLEYGVVAKGGARRVTVVVDGGTHQVSGPPAAFTPSTHPLPKDEPSPIDQWGVKGYRSAGGEETERFECRITLDGKPVIVASNGGTGGGNMYQTLKAGQQGLVARLEADVKAAIAQFGGDQTFEAIDFWLAWRQHRSPFQTFRDYIVADREEPAK